VRFHRVLVAIGTAALLGGAAFAAGDGSEQRPAAPIEAKVLQQIAQKGSAPFWIVLRERADLGAATGIHDRAARGRFVYRRLTGVAERSQARLRKLLDRRGIRYEPFWIANAIHVDSAGQDTLDTVAALPEVREILGRRVYHVPRTTKAPAVNSPQTTEWGLNAIHAPDVWSMFGDRGEGIVVANIDTGVRYSHQALVAQYRGNNGSSFDHNYNWWDPNGECANNTPCDTNGHGTHTMGTMVGDDGDPGQNQIGVAPHAKWIAAKGCCLDTALISSAQWILAPTDLNGANPRPDLRPDIVNNSWGGGSGDPFFRPAVEAWIASGIFPAFSNGNGGPGCGTAGSPGDMAESYSAGAFDQAGNIAGFSARGPSAFGGIKPNVAAPGVNVRSSVNTSDSAYSSFQGTSMASPHSSTRRPSTPTT
jgi:subtilisin family serine protease